MDQILSSVDLSYLVFVSLEEDDGAIELVDVIDRRALVVDGPTLRPGSDELIEIARLELVRFQLKRNQVGDAVFATT